MRLVEVQTSPKTPAVGEVVLPLDKISVVVGPNDSGKTTILTALHEVLEPISTPSAHRVCIECDPGEFAMLVGAASWQSLRGPERTGIENSDISGMPLTPMQRRDMELLLAEQAAGRLNVDYKTAFENIIDHFGGLFLSVSRHGSGWRMALARKSDHATTRSAANELATTTGSRFDELQRVSTLSDNVPFVPVTVAVPQPPAEVTARALRVLTEAMEAIEHQFGRSDPLRPRGHRAAANPWILGSTDPGEDVNDPNAQPLIDKVAEAATTLLPEFVSRSYDIVFSLHREDAGVRSRTGTVDLQDPPQVEVSIRDAKDGTVFALHDLAEGFQLWAQLAIFEALAQVERYCRLLEFLADCWVDADRAACEGDELDAALKSLHEQSLDRIVAMLQDAVSRVIDAPESEPLDLPVERLLGVLPPRVYLIDEPEQHLHPKLQVEAAQWLDDTLRQRNAQAVITTHAPAFLRGGEGYSHSYVVRREGGASVETFAPEDLDATDVMAQELGLDRGQLLLYVRVVLYVEGPMDRAVITTLFERELRRSNIVVATMKGVANATEILHDPLVRFTSARIAALFDNLSDRDLEDIRACGGSKARAPAREAKAEVRNARNLVEAACDARRKIEIFGIPAQDVFDLLDDTCITQIAPDWPGHSKAQQAFEKVQDGRERSGKRASRSAGERKKYYERYGRGLVSEPKCRQIAQAMVANEVLPKELVKVVGDLERLALEV